MIAAKKICIAKNETVELKRGAASGWNASRLDMHVTRALDNLTGTAISFCCEQKVTKQKNPFLF